MARRQEAGLIDIDLVTKHQMRKVYGLWRLYHAEDHIITWHQAKQRLVEDFKLRMAAKEKPVTRVEDKFECLKTLQASREMVFELEKHRIALVLLIQLAGCPGIRLQALLQLR